MKNDAFPRDLYDELVAIVRGYQRRLWSNRPEDQRRNQAVDQACAWIGREFPGPCGDELCKAIRRNCSDGREFPFERLGVHFMSRSSFYKYRRVFLEEIGKGLGLL